jgi:hypothetical protein
MSDYIKILSGEDTIEINYRFISFYRLLEFIKTLPTLKILKKRSLVLTDDYWADFEYKGYIFHIESPFVHYWITKDKNCPSEIFKHLNKMNPSLIYKLCIKIKNKFSNLIIFR